jgi:hypothetical protein
VTSSDESFSYRSLGGQRGTDGGFVVLPWPRTVEEWQAGPQAEEGGQRRRAELNDIVRLLSVEGNIRSHAST